MGTKSLSVGVIGVFAVCIALVGCERIGGRKITVEFRNAEGIHSGDAVYLAGVKAGSVAGEPSVVNGRARVPVLIDRSNKDGVPAGTVFLLTSDTHEPGKMCLVAYSLGSGMPAPANSAEIYTGVSNRAELLLMVGAEKANKLWEGLTK